MRMSWLPIRNGLILVAIIYALIFGVVALAFGDNLEDFKKEQAQLQERLVQYQQIMQNLQVRLVELNALIQYIENKEAEKVEVE